MDIRVLKARLENLSADCYSGDYVKDKVKEIVAELSREVEIQDMSISAGMIGAVLDELRQYYFKLLDDYGAIPHTFNNTMQRAGLLDDMTITLSKMINYMSFAITRNASSTDPSIQRICAILKPELESYKKEMFTLGILMQNVIADKKLYIEKMKQQEIKEEKDGGR